MIEINTLDILKGVDLKTYYIGESYKKKDIHYTDIQTSEDNYGELSTYVDTAFSDVLGRIMKSLNFSWAKEDDVYTISFTPYKRTPEQSEQVSELLKQAIYDYIVGFTAYQWALLVKPDISKPLGEMLIPLFDKIERVVSMINVMPRRRSTNLAGI